MWMGLVLRSGAHQEGSIFHICELVYTASGRLSASQYGPKHREAENHNGVLLLCFCLCLLTIYRCVIYVTTGQLV